MCVGVILLFWQKLFDNVCIELNYPSDEHRLKVQHRNPGDPIALSTFRWWAMIPQSQKQSFAGLCLHLTTFQWALAKDGLFRHVCSTGSSCVVSCFIMWWPRGDAWVQSTQADTQPCQAIPRRSFFLCNFSSLFAQGLIIKPIQNWVVLSTLV